MKSSQKLSLFDLVGLIWVLIFTFVMTQHLVGMTGDGDEVAIAISKEDLASGFREGVEWHGIYLREAKVGFSKLERHRIASVIPMLQVLLQRKKRMWLQARTMANISLLLTL